MKFNISKLQGTVEGIPLEFGVDLSNLEERLTALESKLGTSQSTSEPAKFFTDEYNFLMDACECGAYITRQTNEGQAVVVDYVKFTGKYTKTHAYGSHIEYVGTSSSKKLYSVLGGIIGNTMIDGEGNITNYFSGTTLSTDQASGDYTDYTYEALDCCINK